ncbi:hypothetical protein [Zoogloea sp.]|nr:hypothetical protein [Zoogloea sp.]
MSSNHQDKPEFLGEWINEWILQKLSAAGRDLMGAASGSPPI